MISESGAVQEYCQAYNLQFSSNGRYRILVPNIFSPTEYDSRGKKVGSKSFLSIKAEIAYEEYTVHYARAARIRHKQTSFYSLMLASSGRKQLHTNAREHVTGVRLHQRNVETAFQ